MINRWHLLPAGKGLELCLSVKEPQASDSSTLVYMLTGLVLFTFRLDSNSNSYIALHNLP